MLSEQPLIVPHAVPDMHASPTPLAADERKDLDDAAAKPLALSPGATDVLSSFDMAIAVAL